MGHWNFRGLGGVSLMFHKLSKIFSWNLCIAEIILLINISSWNFVCVPKDMLWQMYNISAWNSHHKCDFWYFVFLWNYFWGLQKCEWNNPLGPKLQPKEAWLILAAWWHNQMETFSALLAFVRGIHRSPVNSLHKGQWRWALMFS